MSEFSHFDSTGASRMVNVAEKEPTLRFARASAIVTMLPETQRVIRQRQMAKATSWKWLDWPASWRPNVRRI